MECRPGSFECVTPPEAILLNLRKNEEKTSAKKEVGERRHGGPFCFNMLSMISVMSF